MSNKAGIISFIRGFLTLNPTKTTRSDHEKFLYDGGNSVLESIYADSTNETEAAPSIFSVADAGITYDIEVMKVGRRVSHSCFVRNTGLNVVTTVLNIVDPDYKCTLDTTYYGIGTISGGEPVEVTAKNLTGAITLDNISVSGGLLPDEAVKFTLTYNAEL